MRGCDARPSFGSCLQVAAGHQFSDFFPIHFAEVETKADPAARPDVGGQIEFHGIGRHKHGVVAGKSFAADGNDAIAVMVVEEVSEDLLSYAEAGVITLQFPGSFGKSEADFRSEVMTTLPICSLDSRYRRRRRTARAERSSRSSDAGGRPAGGRKCTARRFSELRIARISISEYPRSSTPSGAPT